MAGTPTGTTKVTSSMITNAPRTFPKRRIHRESGLMNISKILMGVRIAIGFVKRFIHPPSPNARIPAASTKTMLITARAAGIFKSFVGGFMPKIPVKFTNPIKRSTDAIYVLYPAASSPRVPFVKASSFTTISSAICCLFPGFRTRRFLPRKKARRIRIAITIQVTNTDSEMGIPPKIGIVKAVSTFNSSNRDRASFSISFPLPNL